MNQMVNALAKQAHSSALTDGAALLDKIDFPPRDRWLAEWMKLSLRSSTDIKYFGG